MIYDPKLRFMVHKVLPCFYWVLIPWFLVFGVPFYVLTIMIKKLKKELHPLHPKTEEDAYVLFFALPVLYLCFVLGLLMIPFWLAFVPYKLFKKFPTLIIFLKKFIH